MPEFPYDIAQNPAPIPETGQEFQQTKQDLVNAIMATLYQLLPSNYVATERGPWYTMQFQAIAEQIASFQITAQEIFKDTDWNFTRPEFLYEILGTLVFPASTPATGFPQINGDITFRDFLKGMVVVLLKGATATAMAEGGELLTDSTVTVLERFLDSIDRVSGGAWTIDDQFTVDVFVEVIGGTTFPDNPIQLMANLNLVLEALKPAHVIYDARFLFTEAFGDLFTDASTWTLSSYYYDDLRKFCQGVKEIVGTAGITLTDRTLFTDTTRSFANVKAGALLRITSGSNESIYNVTDVRVFPYGTDSISRAYTTSPTGLTGTALVTDDVVTDLSQDFGAVVEGETLIFATGPNAGTYRLETLLGAHGGPVGSATATGPATSVRAATSLLRVSKRMPVATSGQSYSVDVDRLGVRFPRDISGEDVSEQFYL